MPVPSAEYVLVYYEKIKYITMGVHAITTGKHHEHGVLEMGLVLEGTARVCAHGVSREYGAGELLLFNPYEPHTISSAAAEPAKVLSVWISGYFGREYFAGLTGIVFDDSALRKLPEETLSGLRSLLLTAARCYFRQEDGYQMACVGHVSLLLTQLYRLLPHKHSSEAENAIRKKKMGRMRRIALYMERNYKKKLTMSELAKSEGVTTAYMSRVFRELFGMSFQEYLNLLRLERAIPLMRDTTMFLVDICMECGFSDTRYLNAVCQKEFGCNATVFRSQFRQEDPRVLSRKVQQNIQEPKLNDAESLCLLEKFSA